MVKKRIVDCQRYNKLLRKGNGCTSRTIRETELLSEICNQMGWEQVDEEKLKGIERVLVNEEGIEIVQKELSVSA